MTTEKLTEEEWGLLIHVARFDHDTEADEGEAIQKALRIIDAHAADRAALVAQLDAMTRDRDVWRRRSHAGEGPELEQAQRDLAAVRAERERLLDALADVDPPSKELFKRAERAEAKVAELTQDRAALVAQLEAAERDAQTWREHASTEADAKLAAEARHRGVGG